MLDMATEISSSALAIHNSPQEPCSLVNEERCRDMTKKDTKHLEQENNILSNARETAGVNFKHDTKDKNIKLSIPKNKACDEMVVKSATCSTPPHSGEDEDKEMDKYEDDIEEVEDKDMSDDQSSPQLSPVHNMHSDSIDQNKSGGNSIDCEEESEMKFICPICYTMLNSQHEFTLHIRSHNNDISSLEETHTQLAAICKGFTCRICGKVLSSSSSLDRHVLVHSGERPFKCKICGVSFTTNGNMHRHMRTHPTNHTGKNPDGGYNSESDGSSDSYGSAKKNPSSPLALKRKKSSRTTTEFNNNSIELSPRSISDPNNKRKNDSQDDGGNTTRRKIKHDDGFSKFKCPVCDREDFLSLNFLETHLEEAHPEYKARCEPCNLVFKNHRVLNLHRFMVHPDQEQDMSSPGGTVGFKDLTFVDFSSEKFPYIARMVCEQSLHRASSVYHKFQCDRCERAFPLASALKIHQQNCCYSSSKETPQDLSSSDNEGPTDLSRPHNSLSESSEDIEDEKRRESFFARLDLQNKSSPSSPEYDDRKYKNENVKSNEVYFNTATEGKDLADIQSIISVTSTGGLIPDLSKSPQPSSIEVTPPDSGSRGEEEEQQDCFAAEFRKMKLRGEFPCRLCTAIFPNLRALKGHNRVHLSASPGGSMGPYRCNMCPHFSSDKSALIRHMRTHNGDRPYECSLCRYAFTTKANCERHLRNRHAKMSREDVKKSIIYHPSEDPTNDMNSVTATSTIAPTNRDDVKRSLFPDSAREIESSNIVTGSHSIIQQPAKIMKTELKQPPNPLLLKELTTSTLQNMLVLSDCNTFRRKSLDVGTMTSDEELVHEKHSLKQPDVPLDLSMDALDLSRKRNNEKSESGDEHIIVDDSEPQDLSKKPKKLTEVPEMTGDKPKMFNQNLNLLTPPPPMQNFDAQSKHQISLPKLDLSQFYSANTNINPSFFLNNPAFSSFSPAPPAAFPPYFLTPPHVLFPRNPTQDFVEMREHLQKELIRGLQLTSGGSLVLDQLAMAQAADRVKTLQNQAFAEYSRRMEIPPNAGDITIPDSKLLAAASSEQSEKIKHTAQKPTEKMISTPRHESSSVKMVIKNGVLIPKQKQRRYRTERPFSCEHCSARFTLRSNMERHIKQQHPQYWTQRQRSSSHLSGRRSHSSKSFALQPTGSLNSQLSYFPHLAVHSDEHSTGSRCSTPQDDMLLKKESTPPAQLSQSPAISDASKTLISDEVKNAIAQQLKSKQNVNDRQDDFVKSEPDEDQDDDMDDEEGEEQLVIDEEIKEDDVKENQNRKTVSQKEENSVIDLASVSRLLDNASTQTFKEYFHNEEDQGVCENSEEDEEGLVAGSTSEGNNSGSDENRSESETVGGNGRQGEKKKSAYSLAPNRVSCPYCFRKFPWSSSLRRHVLTHTGQKPFKCSHCSLLFTTKSNCDRHLLRKHGGNNNNNNNSNSTNNNINNNNNSNSSSTSSNAINSNNDSKINNDSTIDNSELNSDYIKKQNSNYTMRNVPERPYKCKYCPSSTFSTLSNLKKHLSCKHLGRLSDENKRNQDGNQSGYESHDSACDDLPPDVHISSESIKNLNAMDLTSAPLPISNQIGDKTSLNSSVPQDAQAFSSSALMQSTISSDLPFKCHLCDSSFSERQEALDHIRDFHSSEYQLLASKGALEANTMDENNGQDDMTGEENLEQLRGKFPDYANRKVMCAFCLRRFWSAEDLRRHMRTHTGERPFSCDICRRRFTLKHSMLRHRKKHSLTCTTSPLASDEEPMNINNNNNIVSSSKMCNEESDLISNLLGIHDRSIVDKMLISKSAEDAAKLLGVQK